MVNFENFKVNCSQLGSLMGDAQGNKPPTEPQIKKLFSYLGKNYEELSEPQKFVAREVLKKAIYYNPDRPSDKILAEMVLIYCYEQYGKNKVSKGGESPHTLEKGFMAEPAAIDFISKIDGVQYEKNEQLFENKWFKGIPDVLCRNEVGNISKIIEVKTSYDLPSFILSKYKKETSANIYEVMGYMEITGCKVGEIVHVLVDMPEKIAKFEEKRLRERYESFNFPEDEIISRISKRLNDMEYSEIPDEYKIFRRPVTLNKLTMKEIKTRATKSKKWLQDVHNLFTENIVISHETPQDNQEDSI